MWSKFKGQIEPYLLRGECVQIAAPPGFGKSRFGRSLGGLFIDPNLLQTPEDILTYLKSAPNPHLLVLDSFDHILSPDYQSVYKYLKGIRDTHRGRLALVFLVNRPLPPHLQPLLGDLYELVSEHIESLPPLDPSEYDLLDLTVISNNIKHIQKLSGGIPALVKICALALRDNVPLDPDSNPKLKAQLEEMLAIAPTHPAYSQSSLIQDYLVTRPNTNPSATETRLLDLLTKNQGRIISKDQIAQAVYPDVKNYAGVSDHAIDQLIHRLRSKIKHQGSIITTHRGLGYKLT
jgi:biotin operon repressor